MTGSELRAALLDVEFPHSLVARHQRQLQSLLAAPQTLLGELAVRDVPAGRLIGDDRAAVRPEQRLVDPLLPALGAVRLRNAMVIGGDRGFGAEAADVGENLRQLHGRGDVGEVGAHHLGLLAAAHAGVGRVAVVDGAVGPPAADHLAL
jgi:hypothetical protein